jgi:hypothetical protein
VQSDFRPRLIVLLPFQVFGVLARFALRFPPADQDAIALVAVRESWAGNDRRLCPGYSSVPFMKVAPATGNRPRWLAGAANERQ